MVECSRHITSSCHGLSLCLRKLAKYSKSNLFLNACLPLICSTTQGKILLDMLYCRHGAKDNNNDMYGRRHFVVYSQDLRDEIKSEHLLRYWSDPPNLEYALHKRVIFLNYGIFEKLVCLVCIHHIKRWTTEVQFSLMKSKNDPFRVKLFFFHAGK